MEYGAMIIACVGALNARKTLTQAQVVSMVQTYSPIVGLLQTGSLESALFYVSQIVPDETIITSADKAAVMEIIQEKLLRFQ
jgi:phosphatidylserine decarboxylase